MLKDKLLEQLNNIGEGLHGVSSRIENKKK